MRINIASIENSGVYLSTELNSLYYIPEESGLFQVAIICWWKESNQIETPISIFSVNYDLEKGQKIFISDLGDLMRDYMMERMQGDNDKAPALRFNIVVGLGTKTVLSKSFAVISHYGNPHKTARDFNSGVFLMDSSVIIIPVEINNDDIKSPKPYIYSYNPSDLKLAAFVIDCDNKISKSEIKEMTATQSQNIKYSRLELLPEKYSDSFLIQNMTEINFNLVRQSGLYNYDTGLQALPVPCSQGCSFIFVNSYGLREYMFIPGILTQKQTKESTEVAANGKIEDVDVDSYITWSLEVNEAPHWLVENAKALMKSEAVTWLEDPVPELGDFEISLDSNVIMEELSGEITTNPGSLSNFTISFKRNDI